MSDYSEHLRTNTSHLGERADALNAQEVERSRGLDNKASGLLAVAVVLLAAAAGFAAQMPEGGEGARALWTIEVGVTLLFLIAAGAYAVSAIAPQSAYARIHLDELTLWGTEEYLDRDPTVVRGALLNADLESVRLSRGVNARKASRLRRATLLLGGALTSIVALTMSLAVHSATEDAPTPPAKTSHTERGRSR